MDKQQIAKDILKKYNITGYVPKDKQPVDLSSRFAELDNLDMEQVAGGDKNIFEKVASFTGGEKIAQGLAQTIANPIITKDINKARELQDEAQTRIVQQIIKNKAEGKDNTKLIEALKASGKDINDLAQGYARLTNQDELTVKQVLGDALQLGTTIAGVGQIPGVAKSATGATGIVKGAIEGAKTGAIAGGAFGASSGVSGALKEDKSASEIAQSGLTGGLTGAVTGGVLGGVVGGVSGAIKGSALRKKILDGQIATGEKSLQPMNEVKQKAFDIAKQQGFDETDIKFIDSMKSPDKLKAKKMIDLAEKAMVDKRSLERPIDVVGDSVLDRINLIKKENAKFAKEVNNEANLLRGKLVDASPIQEKAKTLLSDLGIDVNKKGVFNFNKSVFKNTPELQSKIKKFIKKIPQGNSDAYDLHIFKKSIDELVNYGVQGEGLKGSASNILKSLRSTADNVLDTAFDSYNKANTNYKNTRDVLELTNDLFGKKVGVSKERGGQLLRSVFSNNTQRPRVMSLIEQLDKVSKNYGGKFDDNLLDQALFTEILEDVYGTQATTSLQGQVSRAVKGTQKVIEGIRNPIKGGLELTAGLAEKSLGISKENKTKILKSLLGL